MGASQQHLVEEQQILSGRSGLFTDKIFVAVFYGCIGFLSTFVGMFGRHAFQVPFIILSLLVCLRFAMRAQCRTAMLEQIKSKQSILILLFVAVVFVYALVGVAFDDERLRLLGKPAIVFLALIVFAYVWAHRDCFNKQRIVHGLFYGIIGGLIGVSAVSGWNWFVHTNYHHNGSFQLGPIPISIYSLNDELKILSVLTFFATSGLLKRRRMLLANIGIGVVIFVLSFWTYGTYPSDNDQLVVAHTASDVVQFGLPLVLPVFLISLYAPRLMTNFLFSGIALLLSTAPWIFQVWFYVGENIALPRATKFLVRAEIWDKLSQLSLQKPFFGHGLDATRYMGAIDFAKKYYKGDEATHPHNMFVQTWMDMGLVGVMFGLLFCYFSWQKVRTLHDTVQPAIIAGICMYVLFALATHSLWQTWSIILLCLMCVYTSLHVSERPAPVNSNLTDARQ